MTSHLGEKFRTVRGYIRPARAAVQVQTPLPDTPEETALLVIDVQSNFCDPRHKRGTGKTHRVAGRIARLAPQFRAAGVRIYAVYYTPMPDGTMIDPFHFHQFTPDSGDVLVPKATDSVFAGSDIAATLRRNGHKNLLACGFNLRACVRDSVMDGLKRGFNICVLDDLTANDRANADGAKHDKIPARLELARHGARFAQSDSVLKRLAK